MIKNKTKKTVLAKKIRYCRNVFQKGFGLMLKREKAVKDTGWLFIFRNPRKISITMAFVSFPIDIIFLDADSRVVDAVEGLKPWRLYDSWKYASYCIELQKGTLKRTRTKIGDIVSFNENP